MPPKTKTVSTEWTKKVSTSHFVDQFYFDTINTTSVLPLKASENIPLLFYIPGLEKVHVALDQIWMKLKFRIMRKNDDGTLAPVADKTKMAPLCDFFYTMFADVECFINDELLDSSKQNYQIESYVHHLLDTTRVEKESLLSAALYFPDKAGAFELCDPDDKLSNPGAFERYNRSRKSRVCEIAGKVWIPFFDSDKTILLDKCSLALRFYPNDPKRCLVQQGLVVPMAEAAEPIPKYEIEILSAELQVGRLKLRNPSVPRATYNFDKIRTLRIPAPGTSQVCGPFEIHRGLAPSLVRVCILSEKQVEGTIRLNRLKFENWGVREISLRLGGRSLPWKTGLKCDFTNNNYTAPYLSLINEGANRHKDISINYDDYDAGYCIFSFDCSTGHDQFIDKYDERSSERVEGSLELLCTFDSIPDEPIVFIVLCYFPSTLSIDTNRKFLLTDAPQTSSSSKTTRSY